MSAFKNVNLKLILAKTGQDIVRIMRLFITQQKAMDLNPVAALDKKTIAARKRRGVEGTKRLYDTGALYKNGFVVEAARLRLEVGLSDSAHPRGKGATYDEIGAWNQHDVTPESWNHNWFGIPKAAAVKMVDAIEKEAERQMFDDGVLGTSAEVRVSL
jgi:hypothetical protein